MLHYLNNIKIPFTLKRRRRSLPKEICLLLWSSGFYPSVMQRLCASFSIKQVTTSKQLSPPTSLLATAVFTHFQFDEYGACVAPQWFIANTDDEPPSPNYFTMQNVPGDGDCMFLAVALAATKSTITANSNIRSLPRIAGMGSFATHQSDNATYTTITAVTTATALRNIVADILEMPNCTLYISQNRTIVSQDLLQQASNELKIQPTEYIRRLRQIGGLYGGGPELTILCNIYQRPIHIYEIDYDKYKRLNQNDDKNTSIVMPIIERGVFGNGVYDADTTHNTIDTVLPLINSHMDYDLHILVVDVSVLEKHACVLFPVPNKTSILDSPTTAIN